MSIAEKLKAPFPKEIISWRVQGSPYEKNGKYSALALAYIDARDVMNRLDEVVGAENWSDSYIDSGKRTYCTLSIRINEEWISKSDAAGDSDVEAEKGAVSDALKRAAVKWGIGRYLYDLDAPWVECEVGEKNGKTYWKKWAVDPWTKIKNTAQPVTEVKKQPVSAANQFFNAYYKDLAAASDSNSLNIVLVSNAAKKAEMLATYSPEVRVTFEPQVEAKERAAKVRVNG
jgi:hypothetical protein